MTNDIRQNMMNDTSDIISEDPDPFPPDTPPVPILEIEAHLMTAEAVLNDARWADVPSLSMLLKKAIHGANNVFENDDFCPTSVSFTLCNDADMRRLNRDFRNKDKPTNVLSFPDGDVDENGRLHIGDIAVSFDRVTDEAKEENKKFEDHFTHLVVHGLLHLYGYDHENDEEAQEMESLEIEILEEMGIKNPYN